MRLVADWDGREVEEPCLALHLVQGNYPIAAVVVVRPRPVVKY